MLTTWTQISRKLLMKCISSIHYLNILWIILIQTVSVTCINWNCRHRISADLEMANLHHPLLSRAPFDILTVQRNFLWTNLPDDVTFNSSKFWGNGCITIRSKFWFFHTTKIFMNNYRITSHANYSSPFSSGSGVNSFKLPIVNHLQSRFILVLPVV